MSNVDGYMENAQGHLVPVERVKDIDKVKDEVVRNIVFNAMSLREEITAFKESAMSEIKTFLELSAEQYGTQLGGIKGNLTISSYDGRYKIAIKNNDKTQFDEKLHIAKKLADECIKSWSSDSKSEVRVLLEHAFQTDKEGNVNKSRIYEMMSYDIADEKWKKAMEALKNSISVVGSKQYIIFYERNDDGKYKQIPLDLAAL